MNDDYVPISCIEHERLDFVVLRRQKLAWKVRDENGDSRAMVVLPTDVATRDQAEWLTYRDAAGAVGVLRLDRIQSADVIGGQIP